MTEEEELAAYWRQFDDGPPPEPTAAAPAKIYLALWVHAPPWQPLFFDGHSFTDDPDKAYHFPDSYEDDPTPLPPDCIWVTPAAAQELLHAAEEIKAAAIVASPYDTGAPVSAD